MNKPLPLDKGRYVLPGTLALMPGGDVFLTLTSEGSRCFVLFTSRNSPNGSLFKAFNSAMREYAKAWPTS